MKRVRTLTLSVACAAVAFASLRHPAWPQDAAYFAGKSIAMTIGFGSGGAVDLYGRTLGRYLVHYLPGQPSLIVLNQLGAGGVVALNGWTNKAGPNGLFVTVGAQSQSDPVALLRTHAKYDPRTFNYVGGLGAYSQGLFINKAALARLYDKTTKPVVMALVGTTLRSGNYQVLWGTQFLGWNVRWVRGYTSTAEMRQALERGEIDMSTFGSIRDIDYLLRTGKFAVLSQSGSLNGGMTVPRASLGNTPLISDLVAGKITDPMAQKVFAYGQNVSQVGMWLALPPRTPEGIVTAYVKAFTATLADPHYQAEFTKIDPDSPVASKADLDRLMAELGNVSPKTLDYLQRELAQQRIGTTD
jgi:tripartite-type tricarboxylate transporter receptor subunit TctC